MSGTGYASSRQRLKSRCRQPPCCVWLLRCSGTRPPAGRPCWSPEEATDGRRCSPGTRAALLRASVEALVGDGLRARVRYLAGGPFLPQWLPRIFCRGRLLSGLDEAQPRDEHVHMHSPAPVSRADAERRPEPWSLDTFSSVSDVCLPFTTCRHVCSDSVCVAPQICMLRPSPDAGVGGGVFCTGHEDSLCVLTRRGPGRLLSAQTQGGVATHLQGLRPRGLKEPLDLCPRHLSSPFAHGGAGPWALGPQVHLLCGEPAGPGGNRTLDVRVNSLVLEPGGRASAPSAPLPSIGSKGWSRRLGGPGGLDWTGSPFHQHSWAQGYIRPALTWKLRF